MLEALKTANIVRQGEWGGQEHVDMPFLAIEVAGESGELLEACKKYLRAERGIQGSTATLKDIADEMGDVVISLDMLATELNIDLGKAVSEKFNKTSDKYGLKTKII